MDKRKIKKYNISKKELEKYLKDHTQKECAKHFGCSRDVIKSRVQEYNLFKNKNRRIAPDLFTKEQKNIIIGTLLGDAYLFKPDLEARYAIKMKLSSKEYVEYLQKKLYPFALKLRQKRNRKPTRIDGKFSHKLKDWRGGWCYSICFDTIQWHLFTEMERKWYLRDSDGNYVLNKNGHRIKTIPKDLQLNWDIVGHLACCDGYNAGNVNFKQFQFCTNSFSYEENEFLVSKFKDIGITSKVKRNGKHYVIKIERLHYFDFIERLKPYIPVECFKYKVDISGIKTKDLNIGWNPSKLNKEQAEQIRSLYYKDKLTQQEIAKIYNVCQATIQKIVRNISYKKKGITLRGSSSISVKHNGNQK